MEMCSYLDRHTISVQVYVPYKEYDSRCPNNMMNVETPLCYTYLPEECRVNPVNQFDDKPYPKFNRNFVCVFMLIVFILVTKL